MRFVTFFELRGVCFEMLVQVVCVYESLTTAKAWEGLLSAVASVFSAG